MRDRIVCVGALVAASLLRAVGPAMAQSCPSPPAEESQARRALAKEWFARAEDSESAGNRDTAVRQYACSLRLVPHPATAFNLAVAAERSGDPLMAADAFRVYLRLVPDASDRTAVEARIGRLEKQVIELRQQFDEAPPPARTNVKPTPAAAPRAVTAPRFAADAGDSDLLPPVHEPAAPAAAESPFPTWPLFVGAAAAAGTGVIFNLVARGRMDSCRDPTLRTSDRVAADQACNSAPTYAYGSYALIGLGAALGAVGAGLAIFHDASPSPGTLVALTPALTSGGGALSLSGAF